MQLLVKRLDLRPEPLRLLGKGIRSHVIATTPDFTCISETHFLGAGVHDLDEALVVLADHARGLLPALPGSGAHFRLFVRIVDDLLDLREIEAIILRAAPLRRPVVRLHL